MAREILFRGKRIDNGKMVEGSYCPKKAGNYEGDRFVEEIQHLIIVNMNGGGYQYAEVDPETVCQYTGLTDKNGRKIFEGDIVKDSSCDLYTVNWSDENGMYEVRQYDCSMENFETFFACDCEVIGNIFDNPELMEVD